MLVVYLVAAALVLVTKYHKVLGIAWEHTALSYPSKRNSWQNSEQKQTHVKTQQLEVVKCKINSSSSACLGHLEDLLCLSCISQNCILEGFFPNK